MLGDEHPDGLTHSQQTDQDLWKAVSAVSAVAAAAELVENEPSRGLGVRSKGVMYPNEKESR